MRADQASIVISVAAFHASSPPTRGRISLKPCATSFFATAVADASFGQLQYPTMAVSRGNAPNFLQT